MVEATRRSVKLFCKDFFLFIVNEFWRTSRTSASLGAQDGNTQESKLYLCIGLKIYVFSQCRHITHMMMFTRTKACLPSSLIVVTRKRKCSINQVKESSQPTFRVLVTCHYPGLQQKCIMSEDRNVINPKGNYEYREILIQSSNALDPNELKTSPSGPLFELNCGLSSSRARMVGCSFTFGQWTFEFHHIC